MTDINIPHLFLLFNTWGAIILRNNLRGYPINLLCPVAAVRDVTYADLRIGAAQDVGSVPGRVHPGIHDRLRRGVAHRDIFARCPVADTEGCKHIKGEPYVGWYVSK